MDMLRRNCDYCVSKKVSKNSICVKHLLEASRLLPTVT